MILFLRSSSTYVRFVISFTTPVRNPSFSVRNIGSSSGKYEEVVKVFYSKTAGERIQFGQMTSNKLMDINNGLSGQEKNNWKVSIEDEDVISITVYLTNSVEESKVRTRVDLSEIEFCADSSSAGESLLLEKRGEDLLPLRTSAYQEKPSREGPGPGNIHHVYAGISQHC